MNDNGTINKVMLVGEISDTPRWHKNENGTDALCFTVTTRETFAQKGQQAERVDQHAVRFPGNNEGQEFKPGQWVHIEGKLKTTAFTDEKGIRRYKTEVVAITVNLLRSGR